MVEYRTFRNPDPPRLVAVWNEAFTQRGSPRLVNNTLLERYVLAKPIFDPKGIFVAESNGVVVGWAHAGMSRNPFNTQPVGATCVIGVRPAHQRKGIGTELLKRCEQYLRDLDEVRRVGGRQSKERTGDQTAAAIFSSIKTAPLWAAGARAAVAKRPRSVVENARLFALMNVAATDATITGWTIKRQYAVWRPISAIRQAA